MRLHNDLHVPAPIDEAWNLLLDVERLASLVPGAAVESVDGDTVTGTLAMKVGPISVAYRGSARFLEKDEQAHRMVVRADAREARGSGTAGATVTARLQEADGGAKVVIDTDLAITGRPAQFGRGVLAEVGQRFLDQVAGRLAEQFAPRATAGEQPRAPQQAAVTTADEPRSAATEPTDGGSGQLDLLTVVGRPLLRRAWPALVALAGFAAGWLTGRRAGPGQARISREFIYRNYRC